MSKGKFNFYLVEEHHRRGPGRPAVRLRHGGHRRNHASTHAGLQPLADAAGLHRLDRAGGHRHRRHVFRGSRRLAWRAREPCASWLPVYVISALGCAFAWNWPSLLVFRFIGGLGIGGSSVLGPVYIAEIAPARWRGLLVGAFQINIVIGILVAYLSNYLLGSFGLGMNEWRWQLGVAAIPAVLFFIMLFGIPRSARWLVTKNRIPKRAKCSICWARPTAPSELDDIIASIHVDGVAALRAALPAQVSAAHVSRVHRRRVQSARRHQRHSLLPERHLRHGRIQQESRATCRR